MEFILVVLSESRWLARMGRHKYSLISIVGEYTATHHSQTDLTVNIEKNSDLKEFMQFACTLADAAGAVILPRFKQPLAVDNKLEGAQFDPVTEADREAESAMRKLINQRYPQHGILGEEHGHEKTSNGLTWVLDPIDGTRAFICGVPVWGTLISLFDGNKVLVGVMDQPFTGERFIAGNGESQYVYRGVEQVARVRDCTDISNAAMMSSAPEMFSTAEFAVQQKLAKQVRLMRYGTDCYAYCMLANGLADLVVEAGLSAYDVQALIPIIENAGGVITDWQGGTAVHGGQVCAAASTALHEQALSMLAQAAKKSEIIL